ncbi:outer membrane beta-barrel protein [Longimicrobium sp.]|uniref:outer membrane beta-barrel protein n=1 Tax=Longimicrobium sp. TaxID=2029185 RepID=UPI002E351EE0|nr:outer membrane beta-barrel protein [Longimicrobium sp.]HEX6036840.1 outer membrane beta-barrel protein [Longimicrobium sp.]
MRVVWMALSAAALAGSADAQLRGFSAEVRAGASAGNYAGAASEFEVLPGAAWGASVSYEAREHLSVHAGYSRASFGCRTGFCADGEARFTSAGLDVGVRYALPYVPAAAPWVSAGIARHALRADAAGEMDDASGWGVSVGAGAEVRLDGRLSVTPGVRYVRHGAGDDDAAMVVADVGLRIRT